VGKPGGERLIIQDMSWEMVGFLGGGGMGIGSPEDGIYAWTR